MLKEGDKAPDFTAPDQNGVVHTLSDYRGKRVVLYFYPKDMTSGCTVESCDFRDNLERIRALGAVVLGVSPDSVSSHAQFVEKESLNFSLLADEERKMAEDYGVWKEKMNYGKTYMGVERTTFIIGADGTIEKIFPRVNVEGHVQEVIDALGG